MKIMLYHALEAHRRYSHLGLHTALGDGFLVHENSIVARVRKATLQNGATFSSDGIFFYATMPLAALKQILRKRVIPYIDNVSCLADLERKSPRKFSIEELPTKRQNFVFHESAHLLAHLAQPEQSFTVHRNSEKNKAFRAILHEAFANAAENVAHVYATTDLQKTFLRYNNYIEMNPTRTNLMQSILEFTDVEALLRIGITAYLFSNHLYQSLSDKEILRALSIVAPETIQTKANQKKVLQYFRYAFDLNVGFRLTTSSFYFKLMGLRQSPFRLFEMDLIQLVEKRPQISSYIEQLSKILFSPTLIPQYPKNDSFPSQISSPRQNFDL